jgi:hypothetical protein
VGYGGRVLVQKQLAEDVIPSSNSLEMVVAAEPSTELQMPLFVGAQESDGPLPKGESVEPQAPIALPKRLAPQKSAKSPCSETVPFDFENSEAARRCDNTTSSHGRHKIHTNTNALETLQSFEREMYETLLDVDHSTRLSILDNSQIVPMTVQIGTSDLTHRIYASREKYDNELRGRLSAADSDAARSLVKAHELANIKKSIKAARRNLSDKYFIEISEGNAYKHAAITYIVYLPIQVLTRQLAGGCVGWRKGGNDSRILVDIHGEDIPLRISCSSNGSREEADRVTPMNNLVVQGTDKTSHGVTP